MMGPQGGQGEWEGGQVAAAKQGRVEPGGRSCADPGGARKGGEGTWLTWWRPGRDEGIDYEVVWGVVLLAGFALVRLLPPAFFTWYACPFRRLTGLPCPTCGMTRATLHAVHSAWGEAWAINPLGTLVLALAAGFVLYAGVVTVFGLPRPRIDLRHRYAVVIFRVLLPVAVLVNWGYLIHHGV